MRRDEYKFHGYSGTIRLYPFGMIRGKVIEPYMGFEASFYKSAKRYDGRFISGVYVITATDIMEQDMELGTSFIFGVKLNTSSLLNIDIFAGAGVGMGDIEMKDYNLVQRVLITEADMNYFRGKSEGVYMRLKPVVGLRLQIIKV